MGNSLIESKFDIIGGVKLQHIGERYGCMNGIWMGVVYFYTCTLQYTCPVQC